MTTTQLTTAQRAILAHAINTSAGKIEWFPENIKGGARKKVLDGLFKRALITPDGDGWSIAAEGYDALGMERPHINAKVPSTFESKLDAIIANAEAAQDDTSDTDAELEAAVTAAETKWAQSKAAQAKTRSGTKQATVIEMLTRPEGATIAQICAATGWQAHTVRGTFAGTLKRKGLAITSDKAQGGERVYRIA